MHQLNQSRTTDDVRTLKLSSDQNSTVGGWDGSLRAGVSQTEMAEAESRSRKHANLVKKVDERHISMHHTNVLCDHACM